jgi:hypothetical protein
MLAIFLVLIVIFPTIDSQIINKNAIIKNNEPKYFQEDFDLLIICPGSFSSLVQPLVDHKEEYGIKTYLASLEEIYSSPSSSLGRDNSEKIKYFIKEAYDTTGIEYVLLIGGKMGQLNKWHLPVRYIHLGNSWEPEILSDLYYADIYDSNSEFASWDSDGDGKFLEWQKGNQPEDIYIDLHPEVSIGRLPCRNRLEVFSIVTKIINYEKQNHKSKSWFNKFIVAAGDTYPELHNPKWIGNEGEYYANLAVENMTNFNPIKLYTSDGSLSHWNDIVGPFNQGCGFIYFVGHGCPMLWTNNLPNSTQRVEPFGIFEIIRLFNINKYPICVVSGCHNLQFDVSIFNVFDELKKSRAEYPPECWGWHMTRKVMGGSIATIGCSALGFTKEDKQSFDGGINELEVEFFRQYSKNNLDIIGDVWSNALSWYISTYPVDWNSELTNDDWVDTQVPSTWILFGDPTLKIGGYE